MLYILILLINKLFNIKKYKQSKSSNNRYIAYYLSHFVILCKSLPTFAFAPKPKIP